MLKALKILICLVIVVTIIPTNASAATPYNHQELSQYKGYGEIMYETVVDQTTFVTGQYTDNKQYVKDTFSEINDYAKFWLNEKDKISDVCRPSFDEPGRKFFTLDCLGEISSSGLGYALTVGDTIKNLFSDKAKTEVSDNSSIDYENLYSYCLEYTKTMSIAATLKTGCEVIVQYNGKTIYLDEKIKFLQIGYSSAEMKIYGYTDDKSIIGNRIYGSKVYTRISELEEDYAVHRKNFNNILSFLTGVGMGITVRINSELLEDKSNNTPFKTINNYIQKEMPKITLPEPKAYLSCPDGTRINMVIDGGTFLDATGKVMHVGKDGVAIVDSRICNLNWEKPKIDYVDDVPAIENADGDFIDILTGLLLPCVTTGDCKITKPKDDVKNDIKPIDNSLVQYVKNAYNYATGTLQIAVDGLKSLGNGAKGITELFGIFFGWLPREMVVLMTGGLGIMIGLRIFRK